MFLQFTRPGFGHCIGKSPWRKAWQPTLVFLPGESHGQRSLAGYSPWCCNETDTTWRLNHHHQKKLCNKTASTLMTIFIWLSLCNVLTWVLSVGWASWGTRNRMNHPLHHHWPGCRWSGANFLTYCWWLGQVIASLLSTASKGKSNNFHGYPTVFTYNV